MNKRCGIKKIEVILTWDIYEELVKLWKKDKRKRSLEEFASYLLKTRIKEIVWPLTPEKKREMKKRMDGHIRFKKDKDGKETIEIDPW